MDGSEFKTGEEAIGECMQRIENKLNALETKVEKFTYAQQLQVKIAALISDIEGDESYFGLTIAEILRSLKTMLRQLSTMQ